MAQTLRFISYVYPDLIRIRIDSTIYTYESSEFFCRRFLLAYERGGRFNALNWFRKRAKVKEKEKSGLKSDA